MKAHIVTVVNSRTRGLAPMMMGNLIDENSNHCASSDELVESKDGELYRLEIRNQAKAREEGRVKLTENVFVVDALVTSEQIAHQNSHQWRTYQNLRPNCKVLENVRTKKQRLRKMCRWGPSIWGPLRYCQITAMRWMMMNPHMKLQK